MGTVNQETDVADWPHLYENRLQWAFDAREAFLSELGSEAIAAFANSVSRSDRREVVVLGESQVGKTTLILRMHGVRDPDSLKRIESVLRGGRGYGNSATSVATEFRVAPGNRFRIQSLSDEEPEALTDEAACKRLATLRDEVEAGQKSALHQIRIEIPRNAVYQNAVDRATSASDLDIIDLPGVGGVDPGERHHTENLVRAHLHRAHLVLIVGKAEGITHLRSSLENDAYLIGDQLWMHQNSRFAIVLTHAASADSICKTLSDPDTQPDSEEAFVDVYRDLIRTDWTRDASMFEAADDVAQLPIFPVELGDITERFNEGDADLVQKWVDGCIERLLQRIHESSSPIADLRYLIDSVQSAQKRSEYHLERYHDQISSLEEERNELDELLDALRGERDHLNEEKAARRRKRRQLPVPASIVPQMEGRKRYVKPTHQRRELQKEMNVHESELLESADSMIDQLFSIARNQGLKRLECWSKDRAQNVIRSSINGSMGRVRGQLNKHSTPAIIQKKKWAKRVGRVKVRATKNARKKCEEIAQACIQEIKNHCDQKIQSLEGEIDDLSSEASHYRKKRDDVDDRIQAVRRHKKEAKATIDSDLRRWKRLKRRFRDAADQEVRTALSRANARSELEAVHFAAYARMVQQTFSSLIQGTL